MWNISKRVFLLIAVNVLVMISISILLNVLGVRPYLTAYGLDYESLMVFCFVWGMGGAFISLGLSRIMAKMLMGVKVVDPATRDPDLSALVQMIHQHARAAGLPKMPEVGIYESMEVNAFATGPTKSRSLVAVSRGLLTRMSSAEVDGVLAHEISHVANGDMVTMTLIQGIVNAFVMFLARVIAFAITQAMRSRDDRGSATSGFMFPMITFVLEIVLMFFGAIVVASFSRWREFRADAGGARLAGRDRMIGALQKLKRNHELVDPSAQPSLQAMKIHGKTSGFMALFSTHPPLDERIRRLEMMTSV